MSAARCSRIFMFFASTFFLIIYYGHFNDFINFRSEEHGSLSSVKIREQKRYQAIAQSAVSSEVRVFHQKRPRHYIAEQRPLISRRTNFIHSGLRMEHEPDSKWNGFVTKSSIFAGEIVLVEYPVLTFGSTADSASMQHRFRDAAIQKYKSDPQFRRIWPSSDVTRGFDHLVRLKVYDDTESKRGQSLFGAFQLFTGIQFGSEPNVAVMFGEKDNEFACIVMAIIDIPRGSKLVSSKIIESKEGSFSRDIPSSVRNLMHQFIDSGEIFQMMNGVRKAPGWTGQRFVQKAACAFHKEMTNPKWKRWCQHIRDSS